MEKTQNEKIESQIDLLISEKLKEKIMKSSNKPKVISKMAKLDSFFCSEGREDICREDKELLRELSAEFPFEDKSAVGDWVKKLPDGEFLMWLILTSLEGQWLNETEKLIVRCFKNGYGSVITQFRGNSKVNFLTNEKNWSLYRLIFEFVDLMGRTCVMDRLSHYRVEYVCERIRERQRAEYSDTILDYTENTKRVVSGWDVGDIIDSEGDQVVMGRLVVNYEDFKSKIETGNQAITRKMICDEMMAYDSNEESADAIARSDMIRDLRRKPRIIAGNLSLPLWILIVCLFLPVCLCQTPAIKDITGSWNNYTARSEHTSMNGRVLTTNYRNFDYMARLTKRFTDTVFWWPGSNYTYEFTTECKGKYRAVTKLMPTVNSFRVSWIERGCNTGYLSEDCQLCLGSEEINDFKMADDVIINTKNASSELTYLKGKLRADGVITDEDICSVDGMLIRLCDKVRELRMRVVWAKDWAEGMPAQNVHFYKDVGISPVYDPTDIGNYGCAKTGSGACVCSPSCSGDPTFCENIGCNSLTDCYCSFNQTSAVVILENNKVFWSPRVIGMSNMLVGIRDDENLPSYVNGNYTCKNCFFDLNDGNLRTTAFGSIITAYQVCSAPGCYGSTTNTDSFDFKLSQEQRINSGNMTVRLWFRGYTEPSEFSIFKAGEDICDIKTCFWCWDMFKYTTCWNAWNWIIAILSCIILLLLLGVLIICLVMMIKCLWMCLKCMKCTKKLMSRMRRAEKEERLVVKTGKSDKIKAEDIFIVSFNGQKAIKRVSLLFTFLVLAARGEACTQTTVMSGTAIMCRQNAAGVTTCSYTDTTELIISPIGQESCLVFKDNNNKALGTMHFFTKGIKLVCTRDDLYYAPYNPLIACDSLHHCPPNHGCPGDCDNFAETDGLNEFGAEAMSHLGWSGCSKVTGGVQAGCVLPEASCLWYRKFLTSYNEYPHKVFKCPLWRYAFDITAYFTYTDETGKEIKETLDLDTINPGYPFNIRTNFLGSATITLDSVSIPPIPALSSCFMTRETLRPIAMVDDCNARGSYSIGKLGEIQCPTSAAAMKIDKSCSAIESIISLTTSGKNVDCKASIVQTSSLYGANILPKSFDGLSIVSTNGEVEALVTSIGTFRSTIQTVNLKISSLIDDNACYVKFLNLTGCFDCVSGAQVTWEAYTDFGSAVMHIDCTGGSSYINVTPEKRIVTSYFHYKTPEVNDNCIAICPKSNTKVKVTGTLIHIDNPNYLIDEEDKDETGKYTFSTFWSQWYGKTILIGAALIIGALAVYIIYKIVTAVISSKKKNS